MWDAFQREMLAALGHEVLVLAPVGGADVTAEDPAATDPAATHPAGKPAREVGMTAMPALRQALLRAVGGDAARLAGLPPLEQLRTPAAKRALWPRLRALRRP